MKWMLFVLVMVISVLLLMCYSLMAIAHDADEREEEMYRKWREEKEHEQMD